MIDTDKYEGHTMTGLVFDEDSPNARLIADAPELLAEVKRLREVIKKIKDGATINAQHDDIVEKQEWEYILELINE